MFTIFCDVTACRLPPSSRQRPERLVCVYETTWRYISEDHRLNIHCYGKLRSHKEVTFHAFMVQLLMV